MKPSKSEIANAVGQMSMLKFFPGGDVPQVAIMQLLERMCGTREHLAWLTQTMVDRVGEWKGPAELRGLLCTRFRPADEIEANCSIPGFSPDELETRSIGEIREAEQERLTPIAEKRLKELIGHRQ